MQARVVDCSSSLSLSLSLRESIFILTLRPSRADFCARFRIGAGNLISGRKFRFPRVICVRPRESNERVDDQRAGHLPYDLAEALRTSCNASVRNS